jgi:NAD(P)-dependent dehydrogenase (short-subunit alcohol dehydrogenase family)
LNFRFIEFYEVRVLGILRSSPSISGAQGSQFGTVYAGKCGAGRFKGEVTRRRVRAMMREDPMETSGKVALVTGGGAGIGRAVAVRIAREGASVVVTDVDEEAGSSTVREIESGVGRATFFRADVACEADAREMVAFAEKEFGGLDVLVNNAGGVSEPYFPDGDPGHWGRAIDLNLRGVMLGIHFGVRAMQGRGGGAIVNVSSVGGIGFGPYDKPEYGAAKAGVVRLTASLATLEGRMGVRVNCVCPGLVDTPASRRERTRMTPEEREGLPPVPLRPEEIADAVLMFVEDETMVGRVMIWREGEPRRLVPPSSPY